MGEGWGVEGGVEDVKDGGGGTLVGREGGENGQVVGGGQEAFPGSSHCHHSCALYAISIVMVMV